MSTPQLSPIEIVNMHGGMGQRVTGIFRKQRSRSTNVYHRGMTALVSQYTPEGFVFGADTLRKDMHGNVVTESATKIWETKHPDFIGAYGFCGNTALEFSDRPMFNILEYAKEIAADLTTQTFDGAQEYVEYFCSCLASRIAIASRGRDLPDVAPGKFMNAMFIGYGNGQAYCLQLNFPTLKGQLLKPRLIGLSENPLEGPCILSGSHVVWNEMVNEVSPPETLADGMNFVKDYITRCINNRTDPYCAGIGGHVQIATVTNQGFNWVVRP